MFRVNYKIFKNHLFLNYKEKTKFISDEIVFLPFIIHFSVVFHYAFIYTVQNSQNDVSKVGTYNIKCSNKK